METISLIIMALGLVALGAIYFISRASRKEQPTDKKLPPIPTLKDQEGEEATSIMEDQPARDGKGPSRNAQDLSDVVDDNKSAAKKKSNPNLPPQLIMFIAAETEEGFQGPDIINALDNSGLTFGDMDVYHRIVLSEDGESSLFNVANGIKPWTLVPDDLARGASTPGLSLVLNLPSPIDDGEALHDFMRTAERITSHLGGVLKNQNQEPITAEQRRAYFAMA
ncbi:MAG: Cell division protein ZipA [uncultured Thiotrichaceae bacterium]|uniref:Cell division protein ZipA n=1 Tax=uncultured Thiotrichaceae bacterium TaxID=298394 RepID=A0A6S6T357_9GAMM|nr:MAG: Cell division protein ZipA [uncultured Thiotrichaceae bacterium]